MTIIWCIILFLKSVRDELKVKIANSYRMTAKKDQVNILQRRHIIEERKEQLEHMNDQRVCNVIIIKLEHMNDQRVM